ncbi:MAG: class I SAM-dependent methyltransferase [Bacteroidia bacterium]
MDIDNQTKYWDSVAKTKTFTHPINSALLLKYVSQAEKIVDFGCGYGRIVKELTDQDFKNVAGFDTSQDLINRGRQNGIKTLFHFNDIETFPIDNNSADCFLLFAVLTCIPSNLAQKKLISTLYSKLKPNGIIYISDYYIQDDSSEVKQYGYLNGDENNFGTFTLPEGATFRHHTKEWIAELIKDFTIKESSIINVKTMNGNTAKAFQIIIQKIADT